MFTIDAHLDLSMNALEWNRDLRQPIKDIRAREKGTGGTMLYASRS
jgi:membrane dipeptidase